MHMRVIVVETIDSCCVSIFCANHDDVTFGWQMFVTAVILLVTGL